MQSNTNNAGGAARGCVSSENKSDFDRATLIAQIKVALKLPGLDPETAAVLNSWLDADAVAVAQANPEKLKRLSEQVADLVAPPQMAFTVAIAETVKHASQNKTFTVSTLSAFINAEQPVPQSVVDALAKDHAAGKDLNNEIKVRGPALYFGQYPDSARVRNAQNLEGVTCLVWDFDGRSGDRIPRAALAAACQRLGVEVLFWDTYSSTGDGLTYRALFPLRSGLAVDCYGGANQMLKNKLGMGPATILPPSQAYFCTPRIGRTSNAVALPGLCIDQILDFSNLESEADNITPASSSPTGPYDPIDHALNTEEKKLALRCLQLIPAWSDDRNHWIAVVGAVLRGFGFSPQILTKPALQNDEHKALLVTLDSWSKSEHPPAGCQPKYSKGCVVREGKNLFEGSKLMGLHGLVAKAHAACAEGIEVALESEPELQALAMRVLEGKVAPDNLDDFPDDDEPAQSEMQFSSDWPPGFAGELARYIHRVSLTPIKSFSIAGGLFLLSTMVANRYYVRRTDTGLNLYMVLSAPTGKGKEAPRKAIKHLLKGSSFIRRLWEKPASATGLLRAIAREHPYVFAMMPDEFGLMMQSYSGERANPNDRNVIKLVLSLFGSPRSTYSPEAYANPNDNIPPIPNPYLTLLGMATPATLYPAFNQDMIDAGTVNRILVVDIGGVEEENTDLDFTIPESLMAEIRIFEARAMFPPGEGEDEAEWERNLVKHGCKPDVALEFEEGTFELLDSLGKNPDTEGMEAALWQRYREQMIRVAGVLAVGDGGIITKRHVEWAHGFVDWSVRGFNRKLSAQFGGSQFAKLVNKTLDIVSNAKKYSGDKRYGKACALGIMPAAKLGKLLCIQPKDKKALLEHLLETEQIREGTKGKFSGFYVPK